MTPEVNGEPVFVGEVDFAVTWAAADRPPLPQGKQALCPNVEITAKFDPEAFSSLMNAPLSEPLPPRRFDILVNGDLIGVSSDLNEIWRDPRKVAYEGDFTASDPEWFLNRFKQPLAPTRLRIIRDQYDGTTDVIFVVP